jgi:AbrB family looped-hinge helix DNA binding protein
MLLNFTPVCNSLTSLSKKDIAMRITSKGQVTIPQDVRERAGLMPGTDVAFEVETGFVRLVKVKAGGRPTRGQQLVESLRGRGDFKMTTDEIVALMRGPAADEG